MRERDNGNGALWDPLWEYILDDHDESVDERERALTRKSRSRLQRQYKLEREPSLLEVFFEKDSSADSDYEEPRYDSRDEMNDNRGRKTKNAASKRRSQLTEDSGVDNSLWDFFGGVDESGTSSDKAPRRQTRQSVQRDPVPEKANKKSGLFRRFRRDDKASGNASAKKRQVRVAATKPAAPTSVSSKTKQPIRKEESMDPFQMFMEVASKLDPFGSDESDSDDSNTATREDYTEGTESLAEIDDLAQKANVVNEIRLNFTPIRYKSGKDGFIEKRNSIADDDEELISAIARGKSAVAPAPRARIDETGAVSSLDKITDDDVRGVTSFRDFVAFEPVVSDVEKSSECRDESNTANLDAEKSRGARPFGFVLKRLVCCSIKNKEESEELESFPTEIVQSTFPSTRMISDNASDNPKVMNEARRSEENDLGVPSDELQHTKGPQSVYAYDYQDQQHLDVFYTAMGANPRGSIVVRKLGGPPPLIPSSMRNEVIIQVEVSCYRSDGQAACFYSKFAHIRLLLFFVLKQASTVSDTDCLIRQGYWWGPDMAPLANTPGVDVVGKVFQVKPRVGVQFGLKPSEAVLSLTKWGGNSRYMAIDPAKLVKIPDGIDPAEAACLPETYLTAFQVLHFGQFGQSRYEKSSLRGKSILIVGSMANNLGKAIIELALNAGVANIYATAKKKHWKTLISYGIMPLSQEPTDWITRVEETIDLVLASNGGLREDITPIHYQALRPKTGRLIVCGHRVVGNDVPIGDWDKTPTTLVCSKQKESTKMMNQSHLYDVYEQWDRRLDLCKQDLEHLLELLSQGAIKPKILDRIPLNKVARAHELLETKRLSGFLICEPWMRSKTRAVYL